LKIDSSPGMAENNLDGHILMLGPVATSDLISVLDVSSGILAHEYNTYHRAVPVSDLVIKLLENNFRVTLITNSQQIRKNQKVEFFGRNLRVICLPERVSVKKRASTFWVREILGLIRESSSLNFDVVHAHWSYEYAVAAIFINRKRAIISAHDSPWSILKYNFDAYHFAKLILSLFVGLFSSCTIFVSNYLAKSWSWLCRNESHVIGNFTLLESESSLDSADCMRKTICSIGDMSKHKNLICALKGWDIFSKENPGFIFKIAGVGLEQALNAWPEYERYVRNDGIIWMGKINRLEISKMLKTSDVLLHTSLEESYCMAVSEALLMQKPIIASGKCAPIVELAKDAGILVPENSPKDFANALKKFYFNLDLQFELRRNAQTRSIEIQNQNGNNLKKIIHLYKLRFTNLS